MKKRMTGIVLMIFLLIVSCKTQYNLNQITDQILKIQKDKFLDDSFEIKGLDFYRKQIKEFETQMFLSSKDTLFILEMSGIQGDYLFSCWNKIDTVSYTNETNDLLPIKKRVFTKHMMKLVSEWNIQEIKKEEDQYSFLVSDEMVYATRIIIKNENYKIDCIRFRDFFNPERDGSSFVD